MLPNLIDLIIIFESWVMGIFQPIIFALMRWGLFYWFFLTGLIRLNFLINLDLFAISVESKRFDCLIPGIGEYIFRCFEIVDLTIPIFLC